MTKLSDKMLEYSQGANALWELFASMAQAEMEKKEKRQREGIEAKKLRGEWEDYGRPAVIDTETFNQQFERGIRKEIGPTALRRELNLSHTTFYRYRDEYYKRHSKIPESIGQKDSI